MADRDETWFEQQNPHPYLDLMMIMHTTDCTTVKDVHDKLKKAGKWVDVRKFVKKHKHYNPSGLFELFGSFSDQSADDVRDCLIGWILDNYRKVKVWLRMALVHRKLTLETWMENMGDTLTHSGDIALYLLCRMYDKHVYVHTARFGWCTIPMKFDTKLDVILPKCDLELVLLDCWSFGEVLKIRRPSIQKTVSTPVIPTNVNKDNAPLVIPQNVVLDNTCEVSIEKLPDQKKDNNSNIPEAVRNSGYEMRARPPPKKVTHRTSGRKRVQVDYSKYDITEDPPSPRMKKRKVDTKKRPSASHIAAEKYKTKPLNKPRPVRGKNLITASTAHSTPIPTPTPTDNTTGTVTKPASARETKGIINQLMDIDVPQEDNPDDEYNVPIAPPKVHARPTVDDTKQPALDDTTPIQPPPEGAPSMLLPRIIGTAVKIETPAKKEKSATTKKVFKTVEYKLKRKYSKYRKFTCVKCSDKFETQKDLNEHFRDTHPPVKCDLCEKHFENPAAMLRHKYKHYEYMFGCKVCGKGFHFESQKREQMRVHQKQGDWVCFKPKCGKRFKRELELNAHLYSHSKIPQKCEHCTYTNSDPRNLRAHMRNHSDELPFKCSRCGKGFKWIQQRIRHLNSGKCPG